MTNKLITAPATRQFSSSTHSGLVRTKIAKGQPRQVYIGKHLIAIASVQNREENQAALILEFESMNGSIKRCLISRGDLVGCGRKKIFSTLLARGYYYERKHQDVILDYLSGLGCGLPEITASEFDRILMDLSDLVFDVVSTEDDDYDEDDEDEDDEDEDIDSRRF